MTDVLSTRQNPLVPVGVAVILNRNIRPTENARVVTTCSAPDDAQNILRWKQTPVLSGRIVQSSELVPANLLGEQRKLRPRQFTPGATLTPPGPFEIRRDYSVQSPRVMPEPLTFPRRGRVTIPTMEEMFLEQLRRHPRKGQIHQDLTAGLSISKMMEEFAAFMTNAIATGTWSGYGRTWSDFQSFSSSVQLPPCEYVAALFLRRRMLTPYRQGKTGKIRYYQVSTIYNQSKSLLAIGNRMTTEAGWKMGFLATLNRILVKMGAKIPSFQAQPILRSQVYAVLDDPNIPEDQKMIFYLTWKVAGRADDMQKAFADDTEVVTHQGVTYVVVRWRPRAREGAGSILTAAGSGCQKNISHGLGYSCVVDCGDYLPRVRRYLRSRKGKPLSPYTTEQVTSFLKKHVAENLSAHSIKRGALQWLLEQGIPLRLIGEMARHAHKLEWLPMATRVYLQTVLLALAIGTQEATRVL